MKAYYEQDGITIFHGKCEDVLPTLAAGENEMVSAIDLVPGAIVKGRKPGTERKILERSPGEMFFTYVSRKDSGEWSKRIGKCYVSTICEWGDSVVPPVAEKNG